VKTQTLILLILVAPYALAQSLLSPTYFWENKKDWKHEMDVEKEIYVSVKSPAKSERFHIEAGGMVAAPLEFVFKKASEFEELPKVSPTFKKVVYNREKKELYLVTEALGYHANLLMHIREIPGSEPALDWEVTGGSFQGLKGIIQFKTYKAQKTIMTLRADLQSAQIPLPPILRDFALEVVTEKVAKRMRGYLEEEYRKH
jgi:uncharacterized membrane protein